jgi:hypothetical protein
MGLLSKIFGRKRDPVNQQVPQGASQQKIEPVNDGERAWITEALENVRALVSQYSPGDQEEALSLDALDRAFKAYSETADRTDGVRVNVVLNAVGIAFGQYLVDHLGLEWAAVTGEFGCELAVVGLRGIADFLVFPPNFVAKRWQRQEVDFLKASYAAIAEEYDKARRLCSR